MTSRHLPVLANLVAFPEEGYLRAMRDEIVAAAKDDPAVVHLLIDHLIEAIEEVGAYVASGLSETE